MTPELVLDIGQEALWVTALLAAPLLLSALVVGLLVGMVQAATQIQEMTLTFVPKILALMAGMYFFSHYMIERLLGFTQNLIQMIPVLIR